MKTQLNINLNALAERGRVGARRATAFVAMGQKAWSDESITSAAIEAPFSIKLLPDPLPEEMANEVRSDYRLWVIGNALTEIVQGLSHFADQLFEIAVLITYEGKTVPREALNRIRICRNDTSLHSKLQRVAQLGLKVPLLNYTDGWTRARNAFAHNHGIVGRRHAVPPKNQLTIGWQKFQFAIDGQQIENIIGHHVEQGGMLEFAFAPTSRAFNLDNQIAFSEEEILNICFTSFVHVDPIMIDLQRHIGQYVELKAAPEAEATIPPAAAS
jgi:hypothetical protein